MISVVICSVNKALAAQVKRNIDATIGTEWELVLLDNSVLKKGITEVYNMGGQRAQHEIICFVHEDVLFKTQDWGPMILEYFRRDPLLGLVGVAGSKYKSRTLSGWSTGLKAFDCCNILHINGQGKEQRIYSNPEPGASLQQVITLDGVFLCCRKKVWQEIRFDDKLLRGFHLYDIDFSFRTSLQYNVAVTFELDMVHLTEGGSFGDSWMDETFKWHRLHAQQLPGIAEGIVGHDPLAESKIAFHWLKRLSVEKISLTNKMKWLRATHALRNISRWPSVAAFLLLHPIKKISK